MKTIIIIVTMILLLTTTGYCATYYVNGQSGIDSNPGTIGSPWKTINKANQTLVAGDTVYVRGGTSVYQVYYVGALGSLTEGINPNNSGTDANHRITYAVYPGEKVEFASNTSNSYAVVISNKNWIKVTGYDGLTSSRNMKFSGFYRNLWIYDNYTGIPSGSYGPGSDYNEIDHCWFDGRQMPDTIDYRSSTIFHNSRFNWIHDCTFSKYGGYTSTADVGALFELGWESSDSSYGGDNTSDNVIENCTFYHGGHHTLGVHTTRNVIRNNHLHNEKWWYYSVDGKKYGYRNIYAAGNTGSAYHGFNLIEGNRISHAGPNINPNNAGGEGIALNQTNDIIRYNSFYANGLGGIFIQCGSGEECSNNHIYNNTWLSNGFLDNSIPSSASSVTDLKRRPICVWIGGLSWDNYMNTAIKNNLMWKNQQGPEGRSQIVTDGIGFDNVFRGGTVISNNWTDPNGNPKFYNEGPYGTPSMSDPDFRLSDPFSSTIPNLRLQADSPAINKGTHLTTSTNSGSSSTNLTVADAQYFQPGWGNGAGGGASVQPDWIAIGTTINIVQISSINYSTNTITLASPMTWAVGAPIWLEIKSDGAQVLSGSAPDMGAHEYIGLRPLPPQNLRIGLP